ncbi:hypothetical protein KIW84_060842 [Lathyrus oleraceus]|uniref:Retrotransposon gag domain-containing protein n=1 Tax=Pisum sativum TaxID=3888 RepID=A0A9D5A3I3_PEA|nr:hypothetical protein KIW84_060842 [Pisum sativum]
MVVQSFADFATNSANPYFLHPNENPALVLVSPSLDDKNYHTWFSHSDIFRISDIQEELYKFRQGTLDVSNYFTHLKVLWDELENYRPIRSCSCAIPCSCGATASIRRYREQDYVIRFLKGLNEKFTHSKSQIMTMNPLPEIDKAFSLVIQQEREMNNIISSIMPVVGKGEEGVALSAQASPDAQPNKNNQYRGKYQGCGGQRGQNRVCTHCGRTNHTIDTCFIKLGYPPGFKHRSKGNVSGPQQSATIKNASDNSVSSTSGSASGVSANASYGLTQEQYNNILALLQHSKIPSITNSVSTSPLVLNSLSSTANGKSLTLWILDTRATYHISFNLSAFTSYKSIVPVSVTLPDGSQLSASISGFVHLTPSLVLHNVLYIPSFNVNLISIAKLLQNNNYSVQFNANSCSIMQNPSMETIGIAELQNGLLPTPLLQLKSPHEILYQEPPSLIHLKVFGCLCYVSTIIAHRTKFDPRASKAIFLGYKEGTKGYILSQSTLLGDATPLGDVTTDTESPLFPSQNDLSTLPPSTENNCASPDSTTDNPITPASTEHSLVPYSTLGPSSYLLTPNTNYVPLSTYLSDLDPLPLSISPTTDISSSSPPQYQPQSRQSTRISNPPSYLADYHCYSIYAKSQPSKS